MASGFIRYEIKNGVEYASVYKAKRSNGKKVNDVEWLGRVIDKQNGIYRNRERGTYKFTLENGITDIQPAKKEKLILDFGDSYLLHVMLIRSGLMSLINQVFGDMTNDLMSLVFYKSLLGGANCYAQAWWEGAYARILFPDASLASQRISETIAELGDEWLHRVFFKEYLQYVSSQYGAVGSGVLIDSSGLPNDISSPLTAVNNHNGVLSKESRLILVHDRNSGLPIYFRYAAGNIVDVSTLETTMAEMQAYGIDIEHAIVDAGYYSEKNIKALRAKRVSFVLRMPPNRKLYKELITQHTSDLQDAKYLVKYRDRFVYVKRIAIDLFDATSYAYIMEDIDRKHDEIKKYMRENYNNVELTFNEMNAAMQSKGLFILVSSATVETFDILPLYYQREVIEQVFDISKNNADLLPLRVHSVDAFRGHLLISFITAVAYIIVNKSLKDSEVCAIGAYRIFRNLKCKVYDDSIIVQEPNKKMNDIAKHVKLSLPQNLDP